MACLFAIAAALTTLLVTCHIAAGYHTQFNRYHPIPKHRYRYPLPRHHHHPILSKNSQVQSKHTPIDVINQLHCQKTVYVDRSGRGHFTSIQKAVESVPWNNYGWFCIRIKKGFYREQIVIPRDKPYVYLRGESRLQTIVDWDGHGEISTSATLIVEADNTRVRGLTFVNSYNLVVGNRTHNPIRQAVATMINADKVAFFSVRFLGLQDTLWDAGGRHYFYRCTIQGAVDFIFGSGQSTYENCTISVNTNALGLGYIGYITAQGRENPNDSNGFFFKNCRVGGLGNVFLGRPWRTYARVVFYRTTMSEVVMPEGWDSWNARGQEYKLIFSEFDCEGAGANTQRRVGWANKHAASSLQDMFDLSYVNSDGWLTSNSFV